MSQAHCETPTLEEFYRSAGVTQAPSFSPFIRLAKTPFGSQRRTLTLMLNNDRWGVYDETGAGKSIPALAAALFYIGFGNKVLILTLPTLVQQVKGDLFSEFQGSDKYVTAHVLQENPAGRAQLFERWEASDWPQVIITTYEMFATSSEWVEKEGQEKKVRGEFVWEVLRRAGYNVVIADEMQKLRGSDGLMFKRLDDYVGPVDKMQTAFFPMTGTPMYTTPLDAYSLIYLTNPEAYCSYYHFERKHAVYKKIRLKTPIKGKNGKEIRSIKKLVGYQRLEELNKNLYARASRTLKSNIPELVGLKEPVIREVPIDLHPKHLELYRRLSEERFLEVGDGEIISALQEQELRQKVLQIISYPEKFSLDGKAPPNALVDTCMELMEEVIDDSKVILFANYRDTVESLKEKFAKFNPAVIYGGMTPSQRETMRDKFLSDPKCRLLIANAEAAGAGLNLQFVSHTVIFFEPTSVPGRFKQAMDRIVRPGQEYECMVYILKALGTVAPMATKEMLRRDTEITTVNRDRRSLRHYYFNGLAA